MASNYEGNSKDSKDTSPSPTNDCPYQPHQIKEGSSTGLHPEEPSKDKSDASIDDSPYLLLSIEPVSIREEPAQPLVSMREPREPVEDEDDYPGLEYEPGVEGEAKVVSQHRSQPNPRIRRVASIEASMELYERFNHFTRRQINECREQVNEIKDNEAARQEMEAARQDKEAERQKNEAERQGKVEEREHRETERREREIQMERRIANLESTFKTLMAQREDKALAAAESDRNKVVQEALEQAEKERKELPEDVEVIKMLEEKLTESCGKLEQTKKEIEEAKKKESMSEQEKSKLRLDKNVSDLNGAILIGRIKYQEKKRKEQEEYCQGLEKLVKRFGDRCNELEKELETLREGNTYNVIEDTKFQVGNPTSAAASGGATLGVMLECFSCHTRYYPSDNSDANSCSGSCRFHPLPAMHYREWRRWPVATKATRESDREKYYWACCDNLSDRRPIGCFEGRHHQHWEMDILMRMGMVSKDHVKWLEPQTSSPIENETSF